MKSVGLLMAYAVLAILALVDAEDESPYIGVAQDFIRPDDLEKYPLPPRKPDSCTKCQTSGFAAPPGGCNSQECVIYDLTSQSSCTEMTENANGDADWKAGLSLTVDAMKLGGKIAAYQIQWFNGQWSGWYVPGTNDLDWKLNGPPGCVMRRVWSYFFDHTHKYILCK
ncbi:hypothetical protein RvY_15049 [Ramazzottius varieornatus]|uniref:C-type lectin domain-containing protein n=1 Tax=Ramazzottius varieornatus TaxID=947166 RepID=A0A1D1W1R2_RAMVA|nr:hypothetical protein RvY_15049 [Ramazzottius varieornatus]